MKRSLFIISALLGLVFTKPLTLKWYGAFNILDGYIPDQRSLLYSGVDESDPWRAVIANTLSQQNAAAFTRV
jgi:hypothetical protein